MIKCQKEGSHLCWHADSSSRCNKHTIEHIEILQKSSNIPRYQFPHVKVQNDCAKWYTSTITRSKGTMITECLNMLNSICFALGYIYIYTKTFERYTCYKVKLTQCTSDHTQSSIPRYLDTYHEVTCRLNMSRTSESCVVQLTHIQDLISYNPKFPIIFCFRGVNSSEEATALYLLWTILLRFLFSKTSSSFSLLSGLVFLQERKCNMCN